MQALRTMFAALLVVSYWTASVLPCAPASESERAPHVVVSASSTTGYAHHAAAGDEAGESAHGAAHAHSGPSGSDAIVSASAEQRRPCHESPVLQSRCPCGCDERGKATTPGARLGLALPPDEPDAEPIDAVRLAPVFVTGWQPQPAAGRDLVPI
jgi:hypothetical protein